MRREPRHWPQPLRLEARALAALACVAGLSVDAGAQELSLRVDCPELAAEQAAAFEARMRAELQLRQLQGSVALSCTGQKQLEWQEHGADRARRVTWTGTTPLTSDELLSRFATLLVPETQSVVGEPSAETEPAPHGAQPAIETAVPRTIPPKPLAPRSASASTPSKPEASKDSAAGRAATQPAATVSLGQRLTANVTTASWSGRPSLGAELGAGIEVARTLWLIASGRFEGALSAPDGHRLSVFSARFGTEWEFAPGWATALDSGVNLDRVSSQQSEPLAAELEAGCARESSAVHCWTFSARSELSRSWKLGAWSPHIGLELAWSVARLRVASTGSGQTVTLPWWRPGLILGVDWGL